MSIQRKRDKRLIDQSAFVAFTVIKTPLPISCVSYEVRLEFTFDGNAVLKGVMNGYFEEWRYEVNQDMLQKWINDHAQTAHDQQENGK